MEEHGTRTSRTEMIRDESRKELGKGSLSNRGHLIQKPSALTAEMKPDQKDISSQQPPKSKCRPTTTTHLRKMLKVAWPGLGQRCLS